MYCLDYIQAREIPLDEEIMKVQTAAKVFTVYHTKQGVELHAQCDRFPNRTILGVFTSYEVAHEYGSFAAHQRGIDFRDLALV